MRVLFIALLLINALFFGWTRGWLDGVVGIKARGDREPERLARQLHPEKIEILSPQAAAALRKPSCLALGPLGSDAALQAAQAALERAGLAGGASVHSSEQAGVWAVATIRLGSKDFQARKEETYKKLRINYDYLQGPPEELPTLLLSRHDSPKAAEAALEQLSQRALKGLRVLQLQPAQRQHELVYAAADGALQAKLNNLAGKDPALAGGFKPCGPAQASGTAASSATAASAAPASAPPASAAAPSRPGPASPATSG
ncbi:hypothetical protein [Roseateles violae]|uniref:SPOR domain-containing protein n=1 Tax=Roseateles violae TaxID=3058042 RepID=A0ABT8DNY6_9BURK|nr:hypothetical protein [Pelomonas sp. PFR6]MDN3918763.1 hypothetical protein [Pelomonas sp. PFR6]